MPNELQSALSRLDELLSELKEEEIRFSENAETLHNQIREVDIFLESLYQKENFDYQVFSPRSVESVYKEDIEEHTQKKEGLLSDARLAEEKLAGARRRIELLENIKNSILSYQETLAFTDTLSSLSAVSPSENVPVLSSPDAAALPLSADRLLSAIRLCLSCVFTDPMRAKLELQGLLKSIEVSRETDAR